MTQSKNNTIDDVDENVLADRLRLLYIQSFPAIFVSLFTAAILVGILWPAADHTVLLFWFGFLGFTALIRLALYYFYFKMKPHGVAILSWERPYFLTLTLTSLTWGIGALFIMPADSLVNQVIVYSFLIGLCGGAISLYSSHAMITIVTILAIIIPATISFLFSGIYAKVGIAIGGFLFVASGLRATTFLGRTLLHNFVMVRQLEASKEKAIHLANIDHMTNLYNRGAFYEFGEILINNAQRNKEELSIIIFDVDKFKSINDSMGHAAGDKVITQIGEILTKRNRKSDVYARIGGEEFALLLPNTSHDKAVQLAEELRMIIENTPVSVDDKTINITASFGVSSNASDLDELTRQADKAMYQSKQGGRNRVSRYQE